ncbi:hypothetical protein MRB53_023832 [Persea americana]|uniref:Uncharacterized protein n=1 Tax=Persea americana TaxID=3435 RepID=A0ACC2LBU2_PERAE|nr:hypothetical protein MRB53_023832 [Persea americana]
MNSNFARKGYIEEFRRSQAVHKRNPFLFVEYRGFGLQFVTDTTLQFPPFYMAESSNTVANTAGTSTTNPLLDFSHSAILEMLADLDNISIFDPRVSINEWDDDKMVGNTKIELYHCNTDDSTARHKYSKCINLSQTIIHNATAIVEAEFRGSNRQVVQAAAYISASLLRLFAKPAATFIKAWDRILAGYSRSYRAAFPMTNLKPMEDNLKSIQQQFTCRDIFKHTLKSFLYCFEDLGGNQQIVRVLFEQHLAFTGMHAYPLFTSACAGLHVESGELLALLDPRMTRSALPVIQEILNNHELPTSEELRLKRKRKTWRYARLFDANVFADLQTKNCRELVLILAYINEALGTGGSGNLLDIHHIRMMSDCEKERYKRVANNIIERARTSRNDPNDK